MCEEEGEYFGKKKGEKQFDEYLAQNNNDINLLTDEDFDNLI